MANNRKKDQLGSGQTEVNGKENAVNYTHKKKNLPNIQKLEHYVLQSIIGQNKQVRQIITAIYRSREFKSIKTNTLIVGSSGTGKTATIKEIADYLHIPYTIEDATKYTQEGYYGCDVQDMIYNLIDSANGDLELAKYGMIIVDEIDKKAGNHEEHDVSGVEVLKSLLKIIEGTKMKIQLDTDFIEENGMTEFDTKNITIVFLGAFSGLDKIRDKRLNTNQLGFLSNKNAKEVTDKFIKEDLIKYGMPEEFVGRIDNIIEMNKLSKEDLATILKKSKLSIFRRYQSELKQRGILLLYDDKIFEAIAEQSLALDTGARELSNTVNYMFENILYDILSYPGRYKKCELYMDIVKDNTKYKLS